GGELTHHKLGHERLASLTRAPKLKHISPEVVGLDHRRQRASFAQGGNITASRHRPEQTMVTLAPWCYTHAFYSPVCTRSARPISSHTRLNPADPSRFGTTSP